MLGAEGAAKVYARLLTHTISQAQESGLPFELRVTGGEVAAFRELYGADVAIVDQGAGDLGARMARVAAPCLIIGSDCPAISPRLLRAAAGALEESDVVIGPATDGGYYLIGMANPMPFLFDDMEWSTPRVFADTIARLASRGIGLGVLPELSDVDTGEDLAAWPEFQ